MRNFIEKLQLFMTVASRLSFTAAADEHQLTRSMVSQTIQNLEQDLGVKLFNRNTRHMALTVAGERLLEEGHALLLNYANLLQSIQSDKQQLQGTLRLGMQSDIGHLEIIPLICDFQRIYPNVEIEVLLSDTVVGFDESNYDMVFRVLSEKTPIKPDSLYAIELKRIPVSICASPAYFKDRTFPQDLESLASCDWVIPAMLANSQVFSLYDSKGHEHLLPIKGKLRINNAKGIYTALKQGAGLCATLEDFVKQELVNGELIRIPLPFSFPDRILYLVYQEKHFMALRTRRFIDFIKDHYRS